MYSLKPNNLSGYDGITGTNLKACASLFSHPFCYICNPRYIWVFLLTVLNCCNKTTSQERRQNQYEKLEAYFIFHSDIMASNTHLQEDTGIT